MKTLEIICESCEAHMRLTSSLLSHVVGKSGRVSCKRCGNKVLLDGMGEQVRVVGGGSEYEPLLELEEVDGFSETPPVVDPHLRELPAPLAPERPLGHSSLPPPLPEEAVRSSRPSSKGVLEVPMQPGLLELVEQVENSTDREEPFEAPPPPRATEDSLSPHAIDNEDGLVPLGREFRSSPFASQRDETYRSLFPEARRRQEKKKAAVSQPVHASRAPAPPRAGELHRGQGPEAKPFEDEFGLAAPVLVSAGVDQGPDGSLINLADKKAQRSLERSGRSNAAPWLIAAVAVLALGVSLSTQMKDVAASSLSAGAIPSKIVSGQVVKVLVPSTQTQAVTLGDVDVTSPELGFELFAKGSSGSARRESEPSAQAEKSESAPVLDGDSPAPSIDKPLAAAADKPAAASEAPAETEEPRVTTPFNAAEASAAMREATALASACRGPTDPSGMAQVVVTFAPSGRVTRASVSGPPFAGTQTGGCIASRFRAARVSAFAGDHVTVTKTVTIQ